MRKKGSDFGKAYGSFFRMPPSPENISKKHGRERRVQSFRLTRQFVGSLQIALRKEQKAVISKKKGIIGLQARRMSIALGGLSKIAVVFENLPRDVPRCGEIRRAE